MNSLPPELLRGLTSLPPQLAWPCLFDHTTTTIIGEGLSLSSADDQAPREPSESPPPHLLTLRYERSLAAVEHALAHCAPELWHDYLSSAPLMWPNVMRWLAGNELEGVKRARTTKDHHDGRDNAPNPEANKRSALILFGLSLRELSLLLNQARRRHFTVHSWGALGSLLPATGASYLPLLDQQRSHEPRATDLLDDLPEGVALHSWKYPWLDCLPQVSRGTSALYCHLWPSQRLKSLAFKKPSGGHAAFSNEVAEQLCGDDFWTLISQICSSSPDHRIIITSAHGYCLSGHHAQVDSSAAAWALRTSLQEKRYRPWPELTNSTDQKSEHSPGPAQLHSTLPKTALTLATALTKATSLQGPSQANQQGEVRKDEDKKKYLLALGKHKWKVPGRVPYPPLNYGGLTLGEVAVPVIELSKPHRSLSPPL